MTPRPIHLPRSHRGGSVAHARRPQPLVLLAMLALLLSVAAPASDNAGDGIAGTGAQLRLSGNRADGNGGNGIRLFGMHLTDGGGNRGAGDRGSGRASPAVQCEIGDHRCAP